MNTLTCMNTISSLASAIGTLTNGSGGYLLVTSATPPGSIEENLAAAGALLAPLPRYRIAERTPAGWRLEVQAKPPEARPCSHGEVIWILSADGPRAASNLEKAELLDAAGLATCDRRPVPDTGLSDLSPSAIEQLYTQQGSRADLVTPKGELTAAAAIALARFDVQGLPDLVLVNYRAAYAECAALGLEPSATRVMPGPRIDAVEVIATEASFFLGVRSDQRDVTRRLLRELLVNAIAHRSYLPARWQEPIRVKVWPDRLDVESPGRPPGAVRIHAGSFEGRWARNSHLAALLHELGLARLNGQGSATIRHLAAHLGWVVTAAERADSVVVSVIVERKSSFPEDPATATRQRLPREEVEDRVHHLLVGAGSLSAAAIRERLGMKSSTTRATLSRLVKAGRVTKTESAASSPNQRYVAIPPSE